MACGGDDADPAPAKPGPGTGEQTGKEPTLKVLPSPAYSGFDGVNKYQIPFKAEGDAEWELSDPSYGDIEKTADGIMITVKKAGTVTVKASNATETGAAKLTITQFTVDQYEAGKARYNNGVKALPNGIPTRMPQPGEQFLDQNGACTSCHGTTAEQLKVAHTPYQTGGYSDTDLQTLLNEGKKPAGAVQRSMIPAFLWGMFHKWTVTPEQKVGLVAYLRALPPESQGEFDYPIRVGNDGGIVDRDGNPVGGGGNRDGGARTDSGTGTPSTSTDAGAPSTATDSGSSSSSDSDAGTPAATGDAG